ncbi:MAG: DUF523 domain-containing protein [Caldisericota bacterium]|nr:DUF523 domain-containing protein [Caldisericota bacterium]
MKKIILVSACLLGLNTRHDGKNSVSKGVLVLKDKYLMIPVCPEQLGGLPTPRMAAEIQSNRKVLKENGEDTTEIFLNGAKEVLELAKLYKIKFALLKDGSPSCGSHSVYDGTFIGTKIKGEGITTELLKKNGIKVFSEDDIEELTDEIG